MWDALALMSRLYLCLYLRPCLVPKVNGAPGDTYTRLVHIHTHIRFYFRICTVQFRFWYTSFFYKTTIFTVYFTVPVNTCSTAGDEYRVFHKKLKNVSCEYDLVFL